MGARWWTRVLALASVLLLPAASLAEREPATRSVERTDAAPPDRQAGPRARSVGWPWAGKLIRGRLLRASGQLRHLPAYARRGNFYGTGELVRLLERSAAAVARRWPGSRLSVGELSARRGGYLERHHSHRNGRDADIAFFMRDERRLFALFDRFLGFGRRAPLDGAPGHLRFDDARNWQLVSHLLTDAAARVQYIFVSQPVRNRLLVEGLRRGASHALLVRAAAVLVEPRRGDVHADHFHLRIFCPKQDRPRCRDREPFWPWYDGALPRAASHAQLPILRWRERHSRR